MRTDPLEISAQNLLNPSRTRINTRFTHIYVGSNVGRT